MGEGGGGVGFVGGVGVEPEEVAFGAGAAGLAEAFGGVRTFAVTVACQRKIAQASGGIEQPGNKPWTRCCQLPNSSVAEACASSSRSR